MKLRWPFQILLLSAVVLCIYYPTLEAEVSLVDDQNAIAGIYQSESFTLKNILLPRVQEGGYYRPFVFLTYYLDNNLWGLNIRSMHLDNILLHLINAILVYFLALAACRDVAARDPDRLLPLTCSLLFALHPVATESVNWISGRTDPLAAIFVLSAAILLIVYRTSRKSIHLLLALLLMLAGTLAKETSLGMLLASAGILYADNIAYSQGDTGDAIASRWMFQVKLFLIFLSLAIVEVLYLGNYWVVLAGALMYAVCSGETWRSPRSGWNLLSNHLVRRCAAIAFSVAAAISLYTVLRRIAFRSDVGKIGHTIKLMLEDTNYTISLFLGASGFYLKKFFLPLPLNFFILEIDPVYDLFGIAVLLFCMFLMTRLTLASALFLCGICLFIPALPFAFGTIAWTGYAERYIYISSAFWIVSIMLCLAGLNARYAIVWKVCRIAVPAMLVFFAWQTYGRNVIWQKNLTLLADTVEQSPRVAVIREMYMQSLADAGLLERAKEQYLIGTSRSIFLSEGPDLIMAQILVKGGRLEDALTLYEKAVSKSNFKSEAALRATIGFIDKINGDHETEQDGLLEKKRYYEAQLLKVSRDPMLFYNKGQKAIGAGNLQAAIGFFEKAYTLFPDTSPYKQYSYRLVTRLKNK